MSRAAPDRRREAAELDDAPASSTGAGGQRRRPARGDTSEQARRRRGQVLLVVVTVVIVVAAGVGGYLVNRVAPTTVITQTAPTVTIAPSWDVALPVQVGPYQRNANEGATPVVGADQKSAVSATYTRDGKPAVVILMSRPQGDGKAFMTEANMNAVAEVQQGWCGISGDNDLDGCAVVKDNTAVLVVALADLPRADLVGLAQQVVDKASGS